MEYFLVKWLNLASRDILLFLKSQNLVPLTFQEFVCHLLLFKFLLNPLNPNLDHISGRLKSDFN